MNDEVRNRRGEVGLFHGQQLSQKEKADAAKLFATAEPCCENPSTCGEACVQRGRYLQAAEDKEQRQRADLRAKIRPAVTKIFDQFGHVSRIDAIEILVAAIMKQ